jgi:hypothetical protein
LKLSAEQNSPKTKLQIPKMKGVLARIRQVENIQEKRKQEALQDMQSPIAMDRSSPRSPYSGQQGLSSYSGQQFQSGFSSYSGQLRSTLSALEEESYPGSPGSPDLPRTASRENEKRDLIHGKVGPSAIVIVTTYSNSRDNEKRTPILNVSFEFQQLCKEGPSAIMIL